MVSTVVRSGVKGDSIFISINKYTVPFLLFYLLFIF